MNEIMQILVSGIAVGMIYALIAFGFQLTFATSATLNFGQGEALAFGALVGFSLASRLGFWLMLPLLLVVGAAFGLVVERLAVRRPLRIGSEGWIMATIALGIIVRNVAESVWGKDDYKFPSPVREMPLQLGGAAVLPMELLVVAGALALMLAVELFNRTSIWGKAVIATASDREAAGLMGIDTGRIIVLSYALSCATAAFAGVLIAPLTTVGAGMGEALALKAFAVAVIGSLTSGLGAIVGGLLLGVCETMTGYFLSTGYKAVPGLLLLLVVLALKPAGLFGKTALKKV